jgi:fructose-1,6-bisphosphatase/inositol monophosphatase family enzyme
LTEINALLASLKTLHRLIRDAVVAACEESPPDDLARIAHDTEADTIYAVDRVSEALLIDFFEREIVPLGPVLLIAEGLPGGEIMLPHGCSVSEAIWRIIVDPIDGTRGLMYQKRSAWILTGVAPNRGPETNLQDIRLALQTEIPLVKQHLSDTLWAIAGQGAHAERTNRLTGQIVPLTLAPSRAKTIAHGFASFARYFSGLKEPISAIDEEVVQAALGPVQPGKAHCFEDQYISSAGQLYELMAGHDRFVADIRPLLEPLLAHQGRAMGICSHPYDLCTELIARELGVIVTDIQGRPLRAPLDVETGVDWAGYANPAIQAQLKPFLQAALHRRGLL